jgi:hypothetical protein
MDMDDLIGLAEFSKKRRHRGRNGKCIEGVSAGKPELPSDDHDTTDHCGL